ncbi:hypothetical protein Agabi119p4_8618 [Agaricus bisporus var. burnettii]|uniref:Uncharacterized protein n=1 Tax=Agaricus bisporus var. burnettii TaxID=192524 RepID=A0A8H7C6Y6_AGABI|nr:hypothetical protein Agabi119p4_8618 [Agaricus bisporus var. burnettii]
MNVNDPAQENKLLGGLGVFRTNAHVLEHPHPDSPRGFLPCVIRQTLQRNSILELSYPPPQLLSSDTPFRYRHPFGPFERDFSNVLASLLLIIAHRFNSKRAWTRDTFL